MSDETIDRILRRVATWPGVTITASAETPAPASPRPERADGEDPAGPPVEGSLIRYDETVIAGLRTDGLLDVPVTRRLRDQLLTEGRADRHPVTPTGDRVSYRIGGPADVSGAMWLLRVAYLAHCCRTDRLPPTVVSRRTRQLRLSPELARLVRTDDATTSGGATDGRPSVPPRRFRG